MSYTSFQFVDILKKSVESKSAEPTPLQVLSELSSNMEEMKYQNTSNENNNDEEMLTDDTNDDTNSFPDAIISEDVQNGHLTLSEPILSPIQYPEP